MTLHLFQTARVFNVKSLILNTSSTKAFRSKNFAKSLRNALALVMAAALAGCAFGQDSQTANKRDIEDRARILGSFSLVEGTYSGNLNLATSTKVELQVFHLDEKSGQYADGTDRYLPVLKASLARLNPASTTLNFSARFVQETGELLLVNSDSSIDATDIQSLTLVLASGQLNGAVKSKSGPLGNAALTISSKQSETPKDPTEEINNRLRADYRAIAGEYVGDILLGSEKLYAVNLKLILVEEVGSNGKSKPTLRAVYRPDDGSGEGFDNFLNVDYRADLNPKTIKMTANGQSRYYINIDGIFVNGHIESKFVDMRGREGTLKLVRK